MLCQALHFCSISAGSEAYCLREDISQNSSLQIHQELGDAGLQAAENWLYPVCQESVLKWSCLTKDALGLTRGWHSSVQSSNFLVFTNTSGVLLILDSSSSPITLLMPTTHSLFQTMQRNLLSQVTTLQILPLHSPSRQTSRNYLSLGNMYL